MALISDGSMVLLKYKLNNVCNAGFWPTVQIKKTCIPKWDTHKNQLQAENSISVITLSTGLLEIISPDFLRYFFHKSEFCPLFFLSQLVTDFAGGKSALGA